MCLIIDANCAINTLCQNPTAEFAPVMQAIHGNNATIALGGSKQREEYQKLASVWRYIVALEKAGKARLFPDKPVDELQKKLVNEGLLKSDDPHIMALAIFSGVRLLCSKDQNLHCDFVNKIFVDKPRGSVYQNASHVHLLKKCSAH
jgi:hypothetical protein